MLKTQFIKYLAVIATCFLWACSQSPSSNDAHTGQVSGQIIMGDSVPDIKNFQVRAYKYTSNQWQDTQPTNTVFVAFDGSYVLNLPEGEYVLSLYNKAQEGPEFYYAASDGVPCKNYEVRLKNIDDGEIISTQKITCDPETVGIRSSELLPNIDFDIRNTGNVSGQVTNSDGTQLSRVTIKAVDEEKTFAQTQTDEKGNYTLCCLPEGDYHILADAKETKYINQYFTNAHYVQDATPIAVITGTRDKINFKLINGGIITGKIIEEDELLPVKNVLVTAIDRSLNRQAGKSIGSDANGNYTVYGLPPGEYILSADASNTSYVSCYFKSAYTINDANTMLLSNTETLRGKNFDLQRPGRLIANIVEENTGNLIENDHIFAKIYRASDNELIKTVSSRNGKIDTDSLLEDKYKFEIVTDDTRYAPVFYPGKKTLQNALGVQIFNGETRDDVVFELHIGGSVSGRVVEMKNGTVLFNYTVRAVSQINPMWMYQVQTDSDGDYTLKGLIEGNFIVQVLTGDSSYISEYYQNKYVLKEAVPVSVQYDQIKSAINFSLDRGGRIDGQVTCEQTGTPIEGITLYATNSKGFSCSAQTKNDGTYTLYGIPNGNAYTIFADASGTPYLSEYHSDRQLEEIAVPVSFDTVGQSMTIDFSLAEKPRICGTIVCPSFHQMDYCMDNLPIGDFIIEIWDATETDDPLKVSDEFSLYPNQKLDEMDFDL
ncbi:MAG: carboxypeptidase regulatory-like domain-containing protein [Candidatus Magnetomorum sp.]|nr:carboxypeptidase regulatory-like domain-containing protein [Candidatus Magnetomorum sp.]